MDFNALLSTASKNAKNVNKTLESLDSEVAKEKREKMRQIDAEKRARLEQLKKKKAMMPKREPTPEKKFTIPKKKADGPTVDKAKVQAFLARKEQEKSEDEKRKKAEKEKLIQLRLQSFGGKANKKMEKHFGMDAMDIQVRYGNDHSHLERLQKQKWREQDEQEQMADSFRGGVYKAISQKNKVMAKVEAEGGRKKEPHRVSTSKSNSLAGLSSRHASTRDHFSPPREGKKKEAPKPAAAPVVQKKRPAPAPVDFNALLKAAEGISQGKKVDVSHIEGPPPSKVPRMDHKHKPSSAPSSSSASKKPTSSSSSSHASSSGSKPLPSGFTKPSSSKSSALPPKRPEHSTNRRNSSSSSKEPPAPKPEKKDGKGRFVKGPSPPPLIPAAVPGKRYLPGDVRCKQQQAMMRNGGGISSSSSSSAPQRHSESVKSSSSSRDNEKSKESYKRDHQKSMQKPAPAVRKPDGTSRMSREKMLEMERRRRAYEKKQEARAKQERYDSMSLVERERERDRQKWREQYGDEEEEDDYDDSDMDDFIDDSGMDFDDLSRQEFEDTLRMVNPKYDQKRWKERERMISDRDMVADYRTIAREEARSARLGFMEDLYEAKKNNSEAI